MNHARPERLPPGVQLLDHTADVGLEIQAPDLASLFVRAARGAQALVGPVPASAADAVETVTIRLEAADAALLLAEWLRELLFLRQVRDRCFQEAAFDELTTTRLAARVRLTSAPGEAIREIKGVTYHGLEATREGDTWRARIIFDV